MTTKKIERALADLTPAALQIAARKSERLGIRCTPAEKEGIENTAAALGLSASEYLLAIHEHAAARLSMRRAR